jgi:hypothetical protein
VTAPAIRQGVDWMKHILFCGLILALAAGAARAQNPAKTDPDKYRVILENDRVRVLDYRDKPGDKTTVHHHPPFVLYALSPFKRRWSFPNGESMIREFKTGDVFWSEATTHIGENIGSTETHAIIVEMKESPGEAPRQTPKKIPEDPVEDATEGKT